jgi:hypothetical protein
MIHVMAKVRGECLFCSTKLPLYLKLKSADFCSEAHKRAYYEQQQQLALDRLLETEKILSSARARKLPLREPKGVLTGNDAPRLATSRDPVATAMADPILYVPKGWAAADCQLTTTHPVAFSTVVVLPSGPDLDTGVHPLRHLQTAGREPEPPFVEELTGALASLALNTSRIGTPVEPSGLPSLSGAEALPRGPEISFPSFAPSTVSWEIQPAGPVDTGLTAPRQATLAVASLVVEEFRPIPVIEARWEGSTQPVPISCAERPVWMRPACPPKPPPCGKGPEPPRRSPFLPVFGRPDDPLPTTLNIGCPVPFELRVASSEPQLYGYSATRSAVPPPQLPSPPSNTAEPWCPAVNPSVALHLFPSSQAGPPVALLSQQPFSLLPVLPELETARHAPRTSFEKLQPLAEYTLGTQCRSVPGHFPNDLLAAAIRGDRQPVVVPAAIPRLESVSAPPITLTFGGLQPLSGLGGASPQPAVMPAATPPDAAYVDGWPVAVPAAIPRFSTLARAGRVPRLGAIQPVLPGRLAAGDVYPRAYVSASVSGKLDVAIPELKVALVSGEPLYVPAIAARQDSRTPPLAPPAPLRREAVQPVAVRMAGVAAPYSPGGAHTTRSVEALRRAKEPAHPTPPMCVRIVRFRVTPRPVDDRKTLPAAPAAVGPLPSRLSSALPVSRLVVKPWTDTPPREPVPVPLPDFAFPVAPPPPRLRPVLPAPISPPSAGPPVPPFRPAKRHHLRRVAAWLSTPKGLIAAGALLAAFALQPAWSYFGGVERIGESMHRSKTAVQSSIGSRSGVRFTEDFTQRFDKWEGRRDPEETWSMDEAGFVVPGDLAIYRPSAKMADYRLEFLGGLERKALSWAYRVQDFDNYYVAKILITKPGSLPALSVERYAVIGGKEGPHRINPISLTIRGQSMLRVSMNAYGPDFDIRIDGRIVDSWTDSRIETGGVGFFNAKGESSKISWMKVEYQYDILGRVCSWFADSPVIQEGRR